jgi:hypothetical protein
VIRLEVVEVIPSFLRTKAVKEKVVNVFIEGAGGASRRSREPMLEPSRIRGQSMTFSKPKENLHFKGAALLQTEVANKSVCKKLKFKE